MKFKIPKILRPLRLSEYAPEFGEEAVIQVWVNPPRDALNEHTALALASQAATKRFQEAMKRLQEAEKNKVENLEDLITAGTEASKEMAEIGKKLLAWFSTLWSQGPEETRWSMEDVTALVEHAAETDPKLWEWLTDESIALIVEHRTLAKKG